MIVAVGERVICRRNDRVVDVDNGTRGTVRAADAGRVVIETDAGTIRSLPAAYVAQHVEYAYALTAHGMQGGTVERAFVLAAPHELTKGWSYTALSAPATTPACSSSQTATTLRAKSSRPPNGTKPRPKTSCSRACSAT